MLSSLLFQTLYQELVTTMHTVEEAYGSSERKLILHLLSVLDARSVLSVDGGGQCDDDAADARIYGGKGVLNLRQHAA